eukprot:10151747-Karenia_brevis.AAC.1
MSPRETAGRQERPTTEAKTSGGVSVKPGDRRTTPASSPSRSSSDDSRTPRETADRQEGPASEAKTSKLAP